MALPSTLCCLVGIILISLCDMPVVSGQAPRCQALCGNGTVTQMLACFCDNGCGRGQRCSCLGAGFTSAATRLSSSRSTSPSLLSKKLSDTMPSCFDFCKGPDGPKCDPDDMQCYLACVCGGEYITCIQHMHIVNSGRSCLFEFLRIEATLTVRKTNVLQMPRGHKGISLNKYDPNSDWILGT